MTGPGCPEATSSSAVVDVDTSEEHAGASHRVLVGHRELDHGRDGLRLRFPIGNRLRPRREPHSAAAVQYERLADRTGPLQLHAWLGHPDAGEGDLLPGVVDPDVQSLLVQLPGQESMPEGADREGEPPAAIELDRLAPANHPHRDQIRFVTDRPGHDRRYAIDPTRTETELGWRASESVESGLEKTVRWYLDNAAWWRPLRETRYGGERLGLLQTQETGG